MRADQVGVPLIRAFVTAPRPDTRYGGPIILASNPQTGAYTPPSAEDQGFSTEPPPPCDTHASDGEPLSQLTTEQFSGPSPSLAQLNALVARAIEIRNTSSSGGPAAAVAGAVVAGFFGAAVGALVGRDLTQLYLFAEEYNLSPLGLPAEGLIPGYAFDTKYYDNQGPRVNDQRENVPAFEPIGNFLYGYLGKVAGLSDQEIYASAGLAAGGQDDPRDTNNINAGINYFRQNGDKGFTADQVGARQC